MAMYSIADNYGRLVYTAGHRNSSLSASCIFYLAMHGG